MKTKLFFVCFAFCFVWQANAQTEFAPIGAEWYYNDGLHDQQLLQHPSSDYHYNRIVSEKDTIVDGFNCRILKFYYDDSTIASKKYIIKQDGGKVYYYYQDQFHLFLNFDVQVNDIVEFTFMFSNYDPTWINYNGPVLFPIKYRVESITTNAQNLKTFTIKCLEYDDVPDYYYYTCVYTEKIGHNEVFMPIYCDGEQRDRLQWLRCYSDANFSFVSEEWTAKSLPCDYPFPVMSINTPKDEDGTIYPNPFNDHISVFANIGDNIEIMDISGKLVYAAELSSGINEIPSSHFPSGIFFAKIRHRDNSIQFFKMLKL